MTQCSGRFWKLRLAAVIPLPNSADAEPIDLTWYYPSAPTSPGGLYCCATATGTAGAGPNAEP